MGFIRHAVPTDIVRQSPHGPSQLLSAAIHDNPAGLDGIFYPSRFFGDCAVIHDRAMCKQAKARFADFRNNQLKVLPGRPLIIIEFRDDSRGRGKGPSMLIDLPVRIAKAMPGAVHRNHLTRTTPALYHPLAYMQTPCKLGVGQYMAHKGVASPPPAQHTEARR